jgi:hypothetical protein
VGCPSAAFLQKLPCRHQAIPDASQTRSETASPLAALGPAQPTTRAGRTPTPRRGCAPRCEYYPLMGDISFAQRLARSRCSSGHLAHRRRQHRSAAPASIGGASPDRRASIHGAMGWGWGRR